jgi:hypothetical protein
MQRREFLAQSARLAGSLAIFPRIPGGFQTVSGTPGATPADSLVFFETSDTKYQSVYSAALEVLAHNIVPVSGYVRPVLIEGSQYHGIWLECAPYEGLVYAAIRPDVARDDHLAFFALQREDGQLPCWIRDTRVGFGQIQMVVPIAATAWELAQQTGDSELLEKAYNGGSRWDAWLRRYRDTRRTGLCEGFCTYDTGHDNSPRWKGIPNACPDGDARHCPPDPTLPRLCPDLSATVYGGRVALAAMARALGKNSEADRWLAGAEAIRSAIMARLYVAEDAAFYDLDAQNRFVRVRGDLITRVLGEHVANPGTFANVYEHQIHVVTRFWPAYPFPSIALDDPAFVRPVPPNSWGGAAQALTALRSPRWMEHYGRPADLAQLMTQWNAAILRAGKFLQQMDPLDGTFTSGPGDYSPAALVFFDFTWRLAGVRAVGDNLEWNVRPPAPEVRARYRVRVAPTITAELRYVSGYAELYVGSRRLLRTTAVVRLITDRHGNLKSAAGVDSRTATVHLDLDSGRRRTFTIAPNQSLKL